MERQATCRSFGPKEELTEVEERIETATGDIIIEASGVAVGLC